MNVAMNEKINPEIIEIYNIKQDTPDIEKRWFTDSVYFDLTIFQSKANKEIVSFQFAYDIRGNQKILIWNKGGNLQHSAVDDGDVAYGMSKSPIIVPDGIFVWSTDIQEKFKQSSIKMDKEVYEFVFKTIDKNYMLGKIK